MVYLISRSETLLDVIKAALNTDAVFHAADSPTFIACAVTKPYSKESCLIVDLATIDDAEHIITFTKSSPTISQFPIVVLGTENQIQALPQMLHSSINGFLSAPYSPGEIAAVVASVCEQRPYPENGGLDAAN